MSSIINEIPRYKYQVHQAADMRFGIVLTDDNDNPMDLTGYSVQVQLRRDENSPAVLSLTSETGGGITITPSTGEIAFAAEHADMEAVPAGTYSADVLLDSGSTRTCLVIFEIEVLPRMTRWEVSA